MKTQLTPQDIKSTTQSGEGYNAEFKVRVTNKVKEITEEICAFANSAGGVFFHREKEKSSGSDWKDYKDELIDTSPIKLGESALKIFEMMYKDPNITISEMAKSIGITERRIEKNIKKLRDNDILERRDGERAVYWHINSPSN